MENVSVETGCIRHLAVFLRGINVGGTRLVMKDLQRVLAESDFTHVQTVLASGNVVLCTDLDDLASVKGSVEAALRAAFGYDTWVIVKTQQQVAAIIDGYPFPPVNDGISRHAYAILANSEDVVAQLMRDCPELSPQERVGSGGDVLYWEVPKGNTLESRLSRELARAKYKPLTTTRNLNTMHKVLAKFPSTA